jgi:glutaredoxin
MQRHKHLFDLRFMCTASLLVSLFLGCQQKRDQAQSSTPPPPPLLEVTQEKSDLLFLYRDDEGAEQRAMSLADVPEGSRARVQIVDLSRSPEARLSKYYVQVFDFRRSGTDGLFPGRVVPRSELEAMLADEQAMPSQPQIILYSTSWCGVCKKAKKFLKERGLAFIELDVEKNEEAARELKVKSERANIPLGSVPVIDVGGTLMRGFDPERLMSMLGRDRK